MPRRAIRHGRAVTALTVARVAAVLPARGKFFQIGGSGLHGQVHVARANCHQ